MLYHSTAPRGVGVIPGSCRADTRVRTSEVSGADAALRRDYFTSAQRRRQAGWKLWLEGLSLSTENAPIKFLIANAFHLKTWLVTGLLPWGGNIQLNVQVGCRRDATLMQNLTREQRSAMLRTILEERFDTAWHMEGEVQPVYELTVLPGGPKFHATPVPSTAEGGDAVRKRHSGWTINQGLVKANGITSPQLAKAYPANWNAPLSTRPA